MQVFNVQGMSCGHCVGRVTAALNALPGVEVDSVQIGTAEVRIDPSQTSETAVAEAVAAAGYPSVVQQRTPLPVASNSSCSCCGTK